jgi:hypothetical protein
MDKGKSSPSSKSTVMRRSESPLRLRKKHQPPRPSSRKAPGFITERLGEFLEAMADNVTGIRHLMMRDPKTGQFERVTGSAAQIDKALKSKNAFWIYTKDPNVQAFTDLLNRAIDKPAEHIQVAGEGSITIRWQKDEPETIDLDSKDVKYLAE